jgi:hypothetical protein
MEWITGLVAAVVTATGCLESNPAGLWLQEKPKHITVTENMGISWAAFNKEMAEMKNGKFVLIES